MKFLLTLMFIILATIAFSQNPISPPGVYIADPTARIWEDGSLWVYGSLDDNCKKYCSNKHHALSTKTMTNWKLHKNIFSAIEPNDGVPYNNNVLYAPDIIKKDGLYYLYYCQPGKDGSEGVATSTTPYGPFMHGQKIDVGIHKEIDPTVFIDDDGSAYYAWGQFTLKMARMNPDMKTLDLTTLKTDILNENDHYFHEGAFMTKRNGLYYLVYADISRADNPTCLGYATSTSPFGPYTYRGVIIDNDQSNTVNWNNHGSIAPYKDQWYVFYHKPTHNCTKMRKACVEPITFNEDGSIHEVEMTSQGAHGPLNAFEPIKAESACLLSGGTYIAYDQKIKADVLTDMKPNAKAVYKYIDFGKGATSVTLYLAPNNFQGEFVLKLDKPWYPSVATIKISNAEKTIENYRKITVPIKQIEGIHALILQCKGPKEFSCSLDWFQFGK